MQNWTFPNCYEIINTYFRNLIFIYLGSVVKILLIEKESCKVDNRVELLQILNTFFCKLCM